MADDDDVVYPLIGNDDLIAAGLLPEDDGDIRDDVAALLGIDVGSGSALIDLDGGDGDRDTDRLQQHRWYLMPW